MIDSFKNGISSGNKTILGWGNNFPGMKPGKVDLYCQCPDGSCSHSICKSGKTSFDSRAFGKYEIFIMRAGGRNLVGFGHYWPFIKNGNEYADNDFNPKASRRDKKLSPDILIAILNALLKKAMNTVMSKSDLECLDFGVPILNIDMKDIPEF